MPGIVIAAIITALFAFGVYGSALFRVAPLEERRLLLVLIVLQLPVSIAAYQLVRIPLDQALVGLLAGPPSPWVRLLYAPLTEEPAKLWPLLLPWFRRRLTSDNAARIALALGLGFGLGEIALITMFVLGSPREAVLPWTSFGPFIGERFLVCLVHGLFVTLSLCGWRRWGWGLPLGLLAAMALHTLGNLPILLANQGLLGSDRSFISTLIWLWTLTLWFVALATIARLGSGRTMGGFLFGDATCPSCHTTYPRSILALNLGWRRLERCPACRKWHIL